MNRIVLISLVLLFSTFCLLRADESGKVDTRISSGIETAPARDEDDADSFSLEKKKKPEREASTGEIMSLFTMHNLISHLHNKLVHFPIALAIAGFVLSLLQYRWRNLDIATLIVVGMAALGGTIAYFTGTIQADNFKDFSKDWILEFHEQLGTTTAIGIWVWLIFLIAKPLKKYSIILGVLVFLLVAVTGFVGGVLAQ